MLNNYFFCLFLISFFSSICIFSIWQRIVQRHDEVRSKKDFGLVYLAGAMITWGMVGIWGMFKAFLPPLLFEFGLSFASTANSLLYLLAVQYFDYSPRLIRNWAWWQRFVIGFSTVIVGTGLGIILYCHYKQIPNPTPFLWWPDVIFSVPTTVILAVCFWRSFWFRGYHVVAWLSILVMAIILLVQLPEILPSLKEWLGEGERWLTLSSYALLIMLCFALAVTWGVEEVTLPQPEQTKLTMSGKEGRWVVQWIINNQAFSTYFAPMAYKNFLIFVYKRLEPDPDHHWVHIETALNGGYTDFRRILDPIIDGWEEVAGADIKNGASKEHIESFRRSVFDHKSAGQYRLRVAPQNIKFEAKALSSKEDLINSMKTGKDKQEIIDMFKYFENHIVSDL